MGSNSNEYNLKDTSLKVGSKIMYRDHNSNIKYGEVEQLSGNDLNMTIIPLHFTEQDSKTKCYCYETAIREPLIHIASKDYVGQFMITAGFINKYVTLQLIKK